MEMDQAVPSLGRSTSQVGANEPWLKEVLGAFLQG
jgi:hypothetical protein